MRSSIPFKQRSTTSQVSVVPTPTMTGGFFPRSRDCDDPRCHSVSREQRSSMSPSANRGDLNEHACTHKGFRPSRTTKKKCIRHIRVPSTRAFHGDLDLHVDQHAENLAPTMEKFRPSCESLHHVFGQRCGRHRGVRKTSVAERLLSGSRRRADGHAEQAW